MSQGNAGSDASATPLLRLRGAAFGYGRRQILSGVDLEVRPGDVLGILGPNGSGKTTLFRGILGLIPTRAGRVERGTGALGYVPQRERLDPVFPVSVEEVVHMGCYGRLSGLRRVGPGERELARNCLGRLGLAERAGEQFSSLSGGQRQRVLIARALMVRPRLLLLDEPTTGVDRAAEEQILRILTELRAEGLAVLLVSHQLAFVRDAVPEVLWVDGGRVERGPTEALLRQHGLAPLIFSGRSAAGPGPGPGAGEQS